jgi:hypothetical protein
VAIEIAMFEKEGAPTIVGALAVVVSVGCGAVLVNGKPTGEGASSSTDTQDAGAPTAPPIAEALHCGEDSPSWTRLCAGTLPHGTGPYYPGIGRTNSDDYVDVSKRVIAYYKETKDKGPGERVPADVMQVVVRDALRQVHKAQIEEALGVLDEANALAKGRVAENSGSVDEALDPKFNDLVVAVAELITIGFIELEDRVRAVHRAAEAYAGTAKSQRAQALVAEADAMNKRFGPAVAELAAAREKADRATQRLDDERQRLQPEADALRQKLGLTSFDDGCNKRSADPVDAKRLARLCPIARRVDALNAQIDAKFASALDPVLKKWNLPARTPAPKKSSAPR